MEMHKLHEGHAGKKECIKCGDGSKKVLAKGKERKQPWRGKKIII